MIGLVRSISAVSPGSLRCLGVLLNEPTEEPAYSYIVRSIFLAIVELNLVPFAFISLLFYPCYSRFLLLKVDDNLQAGSAVLSNFMSSYWLPSILVGRKLTANRLSIT